jgi:hypothetical protein
MRLPNVSPAVIRRSSAPSDRAHGRIAPLGPEPVKCGDGCTGPTDTTCPSNCPCTQQSNGTYICQA